MLIFGTKLSPKKYGCKEEFCEFCNEINEFEYVKRRWFLTLFYIPVFRHHVARVKFCKICNNGEYLSKDEFNTQIEIL